MHSTKLYNFHIYITISISKRITLPFVTLELFATSQFFSSFWCMVAFRSLINALHTTLAAIFNHRIGEFFLLLVWRETSLAIRIVSIFIATPCQLIAWPCWLQCALFLQTVNCHFEIWINSGWNSVYCIGYFVNNWNWYVKLTDREFDVSVWILMFLHIWIFRLILYKSN